MLKPTISIILFFIAFSISAQNCEKFAVVKISEIIPMLDESKLAQEELDKLQEQQQILVTGKENEYHAMIEKYRKGGYTNKDSIREYESGFLEMEKSIWVLRKEMESILMKKENELYLPIFEKVNAAIRKIAEKNRICLVFDDSQSVIPYYSNLLDITVLVKQEFSLK